MEKSGTTTRITLEEAKRQIANGEDQTDYTTPTDYEALEAMIADDPDEPDPAKGWSDFEVVDLQDVLLNMDNSNKKQVSIRYSPKVIDYFKSTGKGWQTRMNAVLSAYVDQQLRRGKSGEDR